MEMQLHMKKKEEDKAIKLDCNVLKIKLPKLVITKAAALTSNFGTNLKVKLIDVSYLVSQNFLTLRSFYLSWLELSYMGCYLQVDDDNNDDDELFLLHG